MGDRSIISWTTKTWNPWRGCTRISSGCAKCYMFTAQERYGRDPNIVTRTGTWADPIKWQKEAQAAGKQELVFTCSWSDWFHTDADAWRDDAWAVVKKCPNLIFQILTKRHERIADHLPADWGQGYPNVWLGVSAENQECFDKRTEFLLKIPAVVHFWSLEPLLGPISFDHHLEGIKALGDSAWMLVGGESGPGFRNMDLNWARGIREQCNANDIPWFFKQSSAPRTEMGTTLDGETIQQYPTPRTVQPIQPEVLF